MNDAQFRKLNILRRKKCKEKKNQVPIGYAECFAYKWFNVLIYGPKHVVLTFRDPNISIHTPTHTHSAIVRAKKCVDRFHERKFIDLFD